ncbi:MAG: hypothetical protein A2381_18080 [Bdellovibrionales bacterium RIFOXYB1_FULL_37_110]|nr:MAG: hypothetical protein A2417_06545 [Bdellovibrionales bacterium RIFOXYC1_FULL_37_79]OFZ58582.1 MAG: hypothetical protein A2381_18080 [Bdellovibrionales bacterium RIFOXYB1_FULL_37_110]OFZ61756.1 MAG: hypothetical protein A2577_19610 [Bdellovibrionales bacterium RIFOXYD1_FULL_36_51]
MIKPSYIKNIIKQWKLIPKKKLDDLALFVGDQYLLEVTFKNTLSNNLEYEHIIPFAMGGTNDVSNIKIYCANCNKRKAIKDFGLEKMDQYLNPSTLPGQKMPKHFKSSKGRPSQIPMS